MTNLVIVESPAKSKTIAKYLGKDYIVAASFGHIREIPSKNGSVDVDNGFNIKYEISSKSTKHVNDIVAKAKKCSKLILAPDPDREGESIAWHIYEALLKKRAINPNTVIERVVFHSITKKAVTDAIKNPRTINMDLVNAQQARRALDYLVGFNLSPILWRKLPGSKSAGRVQSVALRLICDREDEIDSFISQEYWSIRSIFSNRNNDNFLANLVQYKDSKIEKFSITTSQQAIEIKNDISDKSYIISSITSKDINKKPQPPFSTSSLQQEAAKKLGFSAKKTMMIAQKLYEGIEINSTNQGLITYMRTDSIEISKEILSIIRNKILQQYGDKYLAKNINIFKSKVKNAQEAHEAIRPTDFNYDPNSIKNYLDNDQFRLYDLIWKRTIASQVTNAIYDQMTVNISSNDNIAKFRATGSRVKFDGYLKIYNDYNEEDGETDDKEMLPTLTQNENVDMSKIDTLQHFTEPPPRYSEASLIKKMEELGIGRPSTYASIISVIQDRGYVSIDKKRFNPEERGRIVTTFLKEFFAKYVEYGYTADLENDLDNISNGIIDWKNFLDKFWSEFSNNVDIISKKTFQDILSKLDEIISSKIFGIDDNSKIKNQCSNCEDGIMSLRVGKFGSFIGCSNYPKCKNARKIYNHDKSEDNNLTLKADAKILGIDSKTGHNIEIKIGPYGPYLELVSDDTDLGENSSKGRKVKKPKRVSIPKNINIDEITIEQAQKLLELPREIGLHPDNGNKIIANIGPYGPYLLWDKTYYSVKDDDILEVGLDRSIHIIAEIIEKKKNNPKKTSKRTKGRTKK